MTSVVDFKNRKSHVVTQALHRLQKEGLRYAFLMFLIGANYYIRLLRKRTFSFYNKELYYFYHPYNHSWVNERTIEVPLVMDTVKSVPNESILEVGNVLRHYFPNMTHDVIDKGEKFPGVINADVAHFVSKKKYDLIVSISTMEHVGFEEDDKDPTKIPKSIEHLKKYLNPGGKMLITVPLKYNPHLDHYLAQGTLSNKVFFFRRKLFNSWVQSSYEDVKDIPYSKEITANGLALLVIEN